MFVHVSGLGDGHYMHKYRRVSQYQMYIQCVYVLPWI